jgi:ABC-type maltose transport system permease subunit
MILPMPMSFVHLALQDHFVSGSTLGAGKG